MTVSFDKDQLFLLLFPKGRERVSPPQSPKGLCHQNIKHDHMFQTHVCVRTHSFSGHRETLVKSLHADAHVNVYILHAASRKCRLTCGRKGTKGKRELVRSSHVFASEIVDEQPLR